MANALVQVLTQEFADRHTRSWAVGQSVNDKEAEKGKITIEMDKKWITVVVYLKEAIKFIHSINMYPTPAEQ